MKYVLVKTDNIVEIVEISTKDFLKKAHELINCSIIEIATPNCGRSPFRMVLDDEGKFNGQKFNKLATIFYNAPDMIFGNILIGKAGFNEYGEYDEQGSLTYFITAGFIESRSDSEKREEVTAWYNAEKDRISEKETMIDLYIDELSTELEAIKTEMKSIESLIQDAIGSVFDWGKS